MTIRLTSISKRCAVENLFIFIAFQQFTLNSPYKHNASTSYAHFSMHTL